MPSYAGEFLSLALIHFLAVVAPGPDFAVTVRQSLVFGRRAGIYTAIGIGAGISVHVLYTLLGFGALIHTIPWLMHAAELLGSAYLLYLGWNFTTHTSPTPAIEQTATEPPPHNKQMALRSFSIGFFTNSTNPKATLFFLAIFTTIV
ncbi:MAG TPA: LysE family translocator, partial [Paenalcaligenes sp.]|nr:LysE family translocator [Paenalcaligenes sp.]